MPTELEGLSGPARSVLEAAKTADDPSVEDRARIDAKFALTLGAYGLAAPSPPPTGGIGSIGTSAARGTKAIGSGTLATRLIWPLLAVGALAAGLGYRMQMSTPAPQPAKFGVDSPPAAQAPAASTAVAADPANAPTAPDQASPKEDHASPATRGESVHPHGFQARRPLGQAAGVASRTSADDSLDTEVGLLRNATEALRLVQNSRALQLLELHATRFPDGALREERQGLRVLALCGLGQSKLALEERARFLRDSAHSVLADRVRAACASGTSGRAEGLHR